MTVAIKKFWDKEAGTVQYALVGGGIIFVFSLLFTQSSRHLEALNQLVSKQKETLEKFTNEQKASLDKLIEALDKSSNEQKRALDKLVNYRPTRPYFTQAQGAIRRMSKGIYYLTVSMQNNEIVAENVISHLLILDGSLHSNIGPIHSRRIENANPTGSKAILSHHHWPFNFKRNARPKFAVFQVQYTNPLSNETYSQALFLKLHRSPQGGTFIQQLFNASSDEKSKIEKYMKNRGISKL